MLNSRDGAQHGFALILVLLTATLMLKPAAFAKVDPSWTPTGSLNSAHFGHTATLLQNGKVLVVGGDSPELYDPATGSWSFTVSVSKHRSGHTATLLKNGKVLVTGGDYLGSAEVYDPTTETWSVTGSLNTRRYLHTATLLQNGEVLVAGGWDNESLASAELYDPNTGIWTVTDSLITDDTPSGGIFRYFYEPGRYGHTATLLQNGKVLVTGGSNTSDLISSLASAQLYDPATKTWKITGNLNASRISHTATLLANGQVLVAGGYRPNFVPFGGNFFSASPTSLNGTELYDPVSETWRITAGLNTVRSSHTATLLPDGKVLVAGGHYWTIDGNNPNDGTYPCGQKQTCSPQGLNAAEVYDPITGNWIVTASLNATRSNHTATLLPTGAVLVSGGYNGTGSIFPSASPFTPLHSAELYNFHLSPKSMDFDGDGITDIGVYRNGTWLIRRSSDGGVTVTGWGGLGQDKPVSADYDGDGKVDHAVYRDGAWFILRSSDSLQTAVGWGGGLTDVPVPADYDGDGKADIAVYRDGVWFIIRSSDGELTTTGWGGALADVPVHADYDGDGKADIAVYRDGTWFVLRSSDGGHTIVGWGGLLTDVPVAADYDGDGKADIAIYRDGTWFIIRSSDGGQSTVGWGGLPQDKPVPADYDGDGKTDIAVYRDGTWFIIRSSDGMQTSVGWGGAAQDIPLNGKKISE